MTLTLSSRALRIAKFVSICALIAGAIFFAAAFHAGISRAAEQELSPKDRASVFDDVWKNVRDRYYDPQFHGVDWTEVGNRYRPLVVAVKNDQEFYALVNRMTGELHD